MRVAVCKIVAARTVGKNSVGIVEPSRGCLEQVKEGGSVCNGVGVLAIAQLRTESQAKKTLTLQQTRSLCSPGHHPQKTSPMLESSRLQS